MRGLSLDFLPHQDTNRYHSYIVPAACQFCKVIQAKTPYVDRSARGQPTPAASSPVMDTRVVGVTGVTSLLITLQRPVRRHAFSLVSYQIACCWKLVSADTHTARKSCDRLKRSRPPRPLDGSRDSSQTQPSSLGCMDESCQSVSLTRIRRLPDHGWWCVPAAAGSRLAPITLQA